MRERSSSLPQAISSPGALRREGDDFREHVGFLGLMLVCSACAIHLMGVLRPLIRPFLWAVFLVMGLTPAVASVEQCLLYCATELWRCSTWLMRSCCTALRWLNVCHSDSKCKHIISALYVGSKTSRKRRGYRAVHKVEIESSRHKSPVVSIIGSSNAETDSSAQTSSSAAGCGDSAAGERQMKNMDAEIEGKTKSWTPCSHFIAHSLAIAFVVLAVLMVIAGFVIMVISSVVNLQTHWRHYVKGAHNMAVAAHQIASRVIGTMPKEVANEIAANMLHRIEGMISAVLAELLQSFHHALLEFLMMGLYVSFWLWKPMPVGSSMQELFKRYIRLKSVACLGYGVFVGILLWALNIDLAAAFGLASFFLSFIPEVGPFVAVLLPTPVILFDSRLESPALTLLIAFVGQLGLKFLFANVIEVKLVEADELMKLHPVVVLLAVAFFGYLWGPTGMLLSVPLVAYFKVALLADYVPARYRDPVLVLLEGDAHAPAAYEQKRLGVALHSPAQQSSTSTPTATPNSLLGVAIPSKRRLLKNGSTPGEEDQP